MSSTATVNIPQINVRQILADKNPSLAKMLPGFLYRWLEKTIHQEEINHGLRETSDKKDVDFAVAALDYLGVKTSSEGMHHVPDTGGVIIAGNHPLGGLDGLALMKECGKLRRDLRFVVNDILTLLPGFETIVVGVNKHGSNARASLEAIEQAYAGGNMVLIFPAGLCSRKMDDGLVRDLPWHKSFVARAVKYQLPVVPTFLAGKNSNWFYNLARWRKKMGIKANLEMLYLPDEMFRQKSQNIHITFGPPISPNIFDKSRRQEEWAELLRQYIYVFPQTPGLTFEEFIKVS